MKKYWLTVTTLGAIAALSLTACSSSDDTDADPSASSSASATASATATATETGLSQYGADADVAALEGITWGEADSQPTLTFDTPLSVTSSATLVTQDGDGEDVVAGDNVTLDYTITSGTDGSVLYSTYDSDTPETFQLVDGPIDPSLYSVLVGGKVGQELIYATLDKSAEVAEGEDTPAIFMALTVSSVGKVLDRATGTTIDPAEGLPSVTLDEDGVPSVDFTGTEMPTELVAQTLIEGDGAEVTEGQSITANYTGWIWDGEQFDSSWGSAPATISLAAGSVIEGWTDGLVGQKVGSQVLLVIPPELGYGDEEQSAIPGGSTLVFVVDILAAS